MLGIWNITFYTILMGCIGIFYFAVIGVRKKWKKMRWYDWFFFVTGVLGVLLSILTVTILVMAFISLAD